jgi:hypothetical protein
MPPDLRMQAVRRRTIFSSLRTHRLSAVPELTPLSGELGIHVAAGTASIRDRRRMKFAAARFPHAPDRAEDY